MKLRFSIQQVLCTAVGLLLTAIICVADDHSNPSIPFLMVYFIPVIWMTWTVGWQAGMAIATLNVLIWAVITFTFHIRHHPSWPPAWNILRGLVFLTVAYMLTTFRRLADLEKKWAFEDPLTGLANRRAFFQLTQQELRRARRNAEPLTLALIDVDDFKLINDRWGHDQGDKVLVWIAQTLRSNLRATDVLARLGGDEMVVLLSDHTVANVQGVMEKVHRAFKASTRDLGVAVSISIGVATFHPVPDTVEAMLHAADKQMYKVKQKGKDNLAYLVLTN